MFELKQQKKVGGGCYSLGGVGHLQGLHLLHHVLGGAGDAGRHVVDEPGDPVHVSPDVTLH